VQVVSPTSSLGESLLGLKAGETAEFEVGPHLKECRVLAVH
jgi:transcription elongation GreA/GreB family factor